MAHTLRELLTGRLATIRLDLDEALDHAEGIDLEWAPTEGMRTLGGQILEIAATEDQFLQNLRTGSTEPYAETEARLQRANLAEYRQVLREVREATLEYLNSSSAEELEAEMAIPDGWWEGLGLPSVPRAEIVRSLAAHEWYHTGQIVSYLWFAGRNPYEWG